MDDFELVADQPNSIVAYTSPFRLVYKDRNDVWNATINDINTRSYNNIKLHRISTSIGVDFPSTLYVHLTYDGTLILPNINAFSKTEKAIKVFNEFLGNVLIGGIFFEEIGTHDLDFGLTYETGYVRTLGFSKSFAAELRNTIKAKMASPRHAIALLDPEHVTAWDIHKAYKKGYDIFSSVPQLSPLFVLYGTTAYVKRNWLETVSNLWISIEQLVSFLWKKHIIDNAGRNISGRKAFLKDFRTWSVANQIEMLYQLEIITETIYSFLDRARKCRNALAHDGKLPDEDSSEATIKGFFMLLASITKEDYLVFEQILSSYKKLGPTPQPVKPSKPTPIKKGNGYWLGPLPPIPGEKGWGNAEYEKVTWEYDDEQQ